MADGKGRVAWQWRVGSNTTPGEWPIIVSALLGRWLDRAGEYWIDALEQRERRLVWDGQPERCHDELRVGAEAKPARLLVQQELCARQRVLELRNVLDFGFEGRSNRSPCGGTLSSWMLQ